MYSTIKFTTPENSSSGAHGIYIYIYNIEFFCYADPTKIIPNAFHLAHLAAGNDKEFENMIYAFYYNAHERFFCFNIQ